MPTLSLESVVGHPLAVAALRRQQADGSLPHALLITGPERIGKTMLALALAGELLDAHTWPGGVGAHPDLWMEDSDTESIGIKRIQNGASAEDGASLQDFLGMRPYAGGRRVAIVGRADRLTDFAANCLLKTLEEPPADTHMFLCTANPDRLPQTILSRCQTLTLAPVSPSTLSRWLEREHGIVADLAVTAAALAVGRPGRALRLAVEPGALNAELDAVDGFLGAAGAGVTGALKAAADLAPAAGAEGRERALVQLGVWTTFLRDVVCVAEGAAELVLWTTYSDAIESWAHVLPRDRAVAMLGATMKAVADIAGNAQPRLCYEVLFLDLFAGLGVVAPPATTPPSRSGGLALAPGGVLKTRATAKKPAARKAAGKR